MADYILVMKDGRVVEEGDTDVIFSAPRDPYTRMLMAAAFDLTPFGGGATTRPTMPT
jgi:oligopeptide transport system ATP-binding protein